MEIFEAVRIKENAMSVKKNMEAALALFTKGMYITAKDYDICQLQIAECIDEMFYDQMSEAQRVLNEAAQRDYRAMVRELSTVGI